jgi:hypothetical protein
LSQSALPVGASGLQTAGSSRATARAPGSHSSFGPSRPTGVAFVYAVLTCGNTPLDRRRLHVRADGAGRHSIRLWIRLIHCSRTYSGQDLGKASGSANRLLSRTVTVTVLSATWPRRRTLRPRPLRCPPRHPGLPRSARRAAGVRNRGEHDLEGQSTAAPGRPAARDRPRPTLTVRRRRSASARRSPSATQGNRTHKD